METIGRGVMGLEWWEGGMGFRGLIMGCGAETLLVRVARRVEGRKAVARRRRGKWCIFGWS